jgi:hypothetical protein
MDMDISSQSSHIESRIDKRIRVGINQVHGAKKVGIVVHPTIRQLGNLIPGQKNPRFGLK